MAYPNQTQVYESGVWASDAIEYKFTYPDGQQVTMLELWDKVVLATAEWNKKELTILSTFCTRTSEKVKEVIEGGGAVFTPTGEFGKADAYGKVKWNIVEVGLEGFQASFGWTKLFQMVNKSAGAIVNRFNAILEADARQRYFAMLARFFDNAPATVVDPLDRRTYTNYPFYYGDADNDKPPRRGQHTFAPGHNHFTFKDSATVTEVELKAQIDTVKEHGFVNKVFILASPTTVATIMAFTAAQKIIAVSGFGQPGYSTTGTTQATLTAEVPLNAFMTQVGMYYGAIVVRSWEMPDNYVVCWSAEGTPDKMPMAYLEPADAAFKGLRIIRDNLYLYPFLGAEFHRYYGMGIQQRGNGAVMYFAGGAAAYVVPDLVYDPLA